MTTEKTGGQVIMDLGDFVPEVYSLRFSINAHEYAFHFGEASVDEVLRMTLAGAQTDLILFRRALVTTFLKTHITQGDAAQLEHDLKLLPYRTARAALDIFSLAEVIEGRVKKKPNGESETKSRPQAGFLVKLRSFFGRAKAA